MLTQTRSRTGGEGREAFPVMGLSPCFLRLRSTPDPKERRCAGAELELVWPCSRFRKGEKGRVVRSTGLGSPVCFRDCSVSVCSLLYYVPAAASAACSPPIDRLCRPQPAYPCHVCTVPKRWGSIEGGREKKRNKETKRMNDSVNPEKELPTKNKLLPDSGTEQLPPHAVPPVSPIYYYYFLLLFLLT